MRDGFTGDDADQLDPHCYLLSTINGPLIIMRLSFLPVALTLALGVHAQQKPLQVYLHPTPAASAPDSPPTLSADQAKAVLAHHFGQPIDEFEEIPSDEALWTHLMGMWSGEKVVAEGEKARVVIIEGGVMPQGG